MRIQEIGSFYTQPLAGAYLTDFPKLSNFFPYDPANEQDYILRYNYLIDKWREGPSQLAQDLKDFNLSLGCGEETLHNIALLGEHRALAVVTGQQPGICTGPLYTVYKALGAIKLARDLSVKLKHPVIPVFWIGSDDHDWAEINHIFVPTAQGPQKITLNEGLTGRRSVGHLPVPQEVGQFLNRLEELTPPMGWQQEGLALLRNTAESSQDLAQWFGKLMTFMFESYGLVLINPVRRVLRLLVNQAVQQLVETAPEVDQILDQTCQEQAALGFVPQVSAGEQKAHLFVYQQGERRALYYKNGVFCDRQGSLRWERNELLKLIREKPELFSPDVVMRPVFQEVLLPVLAYVGGPGEIGYFSEFKGVFEHFRQVMPIIYPRPNLTLIEPLIAKVINKYNVPLEQIPKGMDEFITALLEERDSVGIRDKFNEMRKVLTEEQRKLVKEIASIDPELKMLGQENLRRLNRLVNSFEEKVGQRYRRKNQEALRQLNKINAMVCPLGQWQERVYNVFPYLMKYGPEILQDMYRSLHMSGGGQKIAFID